MDTSYSEFMGRLHYLVYKENHPYEPVDTARYLKEMERAFLAVPAFKNLAQQYRLEELSTNETKLTVEDLTTKYLYLYIFLELMYDRLKYSKAEKDKLYARISDIGDDNNLFGYLKVYTVYYSSRITKWFDHPFFLRFFSSLFLMLNILEAVVEDLVKTQFTNALIGLYLMVTVPFSVNNFRKDEYDNVLCNFTPKWINLYTSWNAKFTYSNSPGGDYFPRTSWCLLGSKIHGENSDDNDPDNNAWLNFRAYGLFASHLLKSQKEFNQMFGLQDAPNENILRDWNRENVRYMMVASSKRNAPAPQWD